METGDGRKFEPRPVETPRLASERATLDRLLQAALRGQGTALVVRGESGLGKTTLVKHVIESVSGFRLVTLSGVEAEQDLSFAGLHRLCAPMLDGLGRLPHPQREALAVAFGERPGVAADRFFLGLAVLGLIAVLGAEQPLVLVVDDAQWLDPPSRQVLALVARRLPPQPVAVVFTASEPIEELEGLPELVLRNLTDAEAHALLAAVVPGPLDPKVRDRFLAESQGNPRTLLDLACSLPPERLAGGLGLPAAPAPVDLLTSRLRSQLGGLPVQVRRLLLVAAADPEGDPTLLSRAAARLDIEAGAIDEARSLGLLGFGSCITFRQPVMRSVVYHGASPDERRCVHRALADAIDPQAARDLRAWHQAHATRARDEDVAHELERSADRARARGGLAAMAALLERSADLTPEPVRRAQRVLAAAQAAFDAGSLGAAAELVASTSAGPLDEFGRARLRRLRAKLAVAMRRAPDAPASLLDAARTLERFDVRLARDTYLEAFEATMLVGQPDTDDRLADIAAAAVAAPPAESPVAADLLLDGLAMLFTEDCELAAPTLRRAVDALSTTGDVRWGGLASRAAAELLDADAMVELATRSVGLARDSGALAHLPTALDHLAAVHVQAGEFGLAARLIEEARAISTATGQAPVTCASLVLGAWRGSVADTADSTEPGRRDAVIRGDGRQITDTAYATAVLDNGMGRYRHALDATRAACRRLGCRHSRAAHHRARQLALVGGDPRRARGLRGDRAAPRNPDHPARVAILRRHPRRPARLARRDAGDPRQRGPLPIQDKVVNDIANANLTPAASWIVMVVLVAVYGVATWRKAARRRARGLVAPPISVTILKVLGVALAGVLLVLICNTDRGVLVPIRGMPWVLLIVLAVVTAWSTLLGRTRFGRHVYAIGGNAEAARRAGIRLARVRTLCFVLASFTAGMAGIIYASRLRSVSTNLDGGTLVLYAVAAAVIGGTSLFGGRGKPIHAVLGGIVIASIDNGMGLQGFSAASKNIVTAIVLIAAVSIDALARRGNATR